MLPFLSIKCSILVTFLFKLLVYYFANAILSVKHSNCNHELLRVVGFFISYIGVVVIYGLVAQEYPPSVHFATDGFKERRFIVLNPVPTDDPIQLQ